MRIRCKCFTVMLTFMYAVIFIDAGGHSLQLCAYVLLSISIHGSVYNWSNKPLRYCSRYLASSSCQQYQYQHAVAAHADQELDELKDSLWHHAATHLICIQTVMCSYCKAYIEGVTANWNMIICLHSGSDTMQTQRYLWTCIAAQTILPAQSHPLGQMWRRGLLMPLQR